MKQFFCAVLLATGFLAFGSDAQAQRLEATMSTGYLGYSKSSTQFDVSPGFYYQPLPSWGWLQLGGEITYQKLSERGGSTRNTVFMAGPIFNLNGSNLADAFYISLSLAYKSGGSDVVDLSSDDPNGFGYGLLFGRRITLGGTWSFRPSVGMISTGSSGLVVRPFAVSYRF
jgi:hypothetical protein